MDVPLRLQYSFSGGQVTGMDVYLGGLSDDQRAFLGRALQRRRGQRA